MPIETTPNTHVELSKEDNVATVRFVSEKGPPCSWVVR